MKFRILLKSFNKDLIETASQQLRSTLSNSECTLKGVVSLPTKIKRFCVLRSPHIDKKSREQFEMRTHKRLIDIVEPTQQTVDSLMKLDLSAGVDVEIKY
jgi:small subunit ribosomal protein S10